MSLEVSNPFPLNIDPKQDSFEKLQLMANVPDSFKVLALEFNTIIEALKYLYANNPNAVEPTAIENEYPTIAAMLADQVNQTPANLQWVADASDDPGIIEGYAYYEKLANSTGTLATDYRRLTADEVIQLETGLIKIEDEIGNSFQTALKIIFGAGFTVQLIPGGGARVFYQGPTNLSEFTNDGEDGINPFVDQSDFPQATQITAATYTLDGDGLNQTNVFVNPVTITIPNDVVPTKKVKSKKTLFSFKSTGTINFITSGGFNAIMSVPVGALVYAEGTNVGGNWIVKRLDNLLLEMATDSYTGVRLTPSAQNINGFLVKKSANESTGFLVKNSDQGINTTAVLAASGSEALYAKTISMQWFGGGYLYSYLRDKGAIYSTDDIFILPIGVDKSVEFRTGTNLSGAVKKFKIWFNGAIEMFSGTLASITNVADNFLAMDENHRLHTYFSAAWQKVLHLTDLTNAPTEPSPDNIITEKAGEIKKTPFDSLFSATAATGGVIDFTLPKIYNSPASPEIGNITDNLTGALIGVVQKIYHNHTVAPTFPIGWVLVGGEYVIGSLNIIYCEWVSATRVEYWIAKEYKL